MGNSVKNNQDFSSIFDQALNGTTVVQPPPKKTTHQQQTQLKPKTTNGFDFSSTFDESLKKKVGGSESSNGVSQLPLQKGLIEKGNIDLYAQPSIPNPEKGGMSTVFATSFGTDKGEVLVSRVTPDGKFLSEKEALDYYKRTGKHLGIFKTPQDATAYSQQLHDDYAAGKFTPEEKINAASLNYQNKNLKPEDVKTLADTDFGYAKGWMKLTTPDDLKHLTDVHNSTPTPDEVDNKVKTYVDNFLPDINPIDAKKYAQQEFAGQVTKRATQQNISDQTQNKIPLPAGINIAQTKPVIFTDEAAAEKENQKVKKEMVDGIKSGDIKQIATFRNLSTEKINKQIDEINKNPNGILTSTGISSAGISDSKIELSDEQKQQIKNFQQQKDDIEKTLSGYVDNSLVQQAYKKVGGLRSHDNLLEIGKQKRQYEEPTPQFEGEQEVSNPLAKTFQNYDDKQKGIDAAINALSMDYAANYKAALADTDVSAKDRVKDNSELINDLIATKANLPNEYLPVQVNYVSRLMGDKISSFHPVLNVFITDADRQKAIEELEKENPGFTQKYSTAIKYINDNGGVETNIPHQGFIGAFNRGGTEATEGIENSVKDFFGFRNRGDRAADELINQYSAYGSGTSFAGRTPDKIIVDKEGLAFKQIPNENYGKTNFNTVFNGLGEFTGGIIPFALLTEGVGELGGVIGKAAKTPLSKSLQSKIGVTGATYLMNYDHNLEQADKLILDNTGAGDFKRGMVANLMTIGQAAAFNIMPANEFIRNNFTVNLAKDAAKFVEGNTLQNGLNKEALAKWLDDIVKPRTLASLKIAGVETAQNVGKLDAAMLLQNHSNAIVGSLFDETGQTKNNDVIQQDIQTLKDATLGGLFFGLPKLVHAPFSMTARDALYDHAQNADENIARINELQSKGLIAPEQANGIIKLINTARKNLDALTNTNEKGLPTSLRQRKIQLAELVRKDVLDEIKKENPNATEQSEGSIKNADENIKTVINETPYIDLSKLPIMEELKNKYGITNPLDIDPRIEYEINGKDISGEDILSQIQNSNNESSETSKLIQTANEQDQSKQQASLNQGNGKTVNLEGNGNKQSGNEKEIGLLEEAKRLSDDVQGLYSGAFKKDPARALFEAATQLNSSESEAKTARSIFGERLSKIALELFPNAKVGDVYESKTTEITPEKGITGSAKDNEQLGKSSIEIKQAEKVDGEDLQSQQETNVEWLDKNKNNFTQIEYSRLNEGLANNDADINKEVRSLRKEQSTKPTSTTETIHTENIKNKFREQFKAKGNTDEHIDAAIALMDARSKSWASEEKGRTPEQWFDRIADVKNGEFETGDVQYQKGGLKATLTGAMSLASVHATDLANRVEPRLANEKKVAFADEYEIPVYDNRKVDATSGKPVTDKNNQYSNVNAGVAKEIVRAANKHGVDPYTAIAMGIQETGFAGDGLDNPLHILFEKANVGKSENVIDASMRILKEKIDYAKKLGKKSEEEILQAWNGYGKIGKLTAAAEEGANINAWYGVDATKGNLDMSKNPLYGKRIVDIRENIVKKNPELVKLIEGEKKNIAYQEQSGVKHGALETLKDGRVIIHALDAPDVSTMVHEIGHIFEKDLTEAEQKIVKEFGGSEPFARGFERYLRDGKSPTPELKTLFDKFKQWLTDIYQSLKGSPIAKKISPEIKQIFDRLLTEQENKKADKTQTENIGIAAKGKELADKIRQLKTKQDKLQTSIFGIPIAIYDGAIETVATAIEKGSELAEAIQKGIEFIGKKAGFDEENFIKHLEDFAAGEKPKIKVQVSGEGEPPKQPPSETESFADNPNKSERTRGAYEHLLDSKIDEEVKQKFKDNGIKYKIAKNESAQKIGRSMIDAYGTDEALKLARLNTFHPSVNSAVFAEAINDYYNKERLVKDPQEKFDAAARWADTYNEYAELLTAAGQFGQYAYNFYKTSPLGFILSAKERLDERRKYFVAKDEKSLREAFEAFKDIPEFKDLFSQEVTEAAKKVKREVKAADRQKIKDAWDKLKLDKNTTYATLVPPQIINGAIEVMKQAHLLGYEVADILKEGIKYINENHKEGWNEEKFKADLTPKIEALINGNATTHKTQTERYRESLKKQIKSLDEQIEAGAKSNKEISKKGYDDEINSLVKERDEKSKQLNKIALKSSDVLRLEKKLDDLRQGILKEQNIKVEDTQEIKALKEQIYEANKNLGLIRSKMAIPESKYGLKTIPEKEKLTEEQKRINRLERELSDLQQGIVKAKTEPFEDTPAIKDLKDKIFNAKKDLGLISSKVKTVKSTDYGLQKTEQQKNIERLEKKLEDLKSGKITETKDKRTLSVQEKDLQDQIFEEKKKLGLIKSKSAKAEPDFGLKEVPTNEERLADYKKRLNNEISELDEQISNKKRKERSKKIELDDDAKKLIEQREAKKKQLDEVVPPEKTAEDILKKWDKKLTKLEPAARKELLTKVLNEIVKNGGLKYDRFKEMYADALGLPSLTPAMEAKLHELGDKLNQVDIARENLDKNPTQENIDAFKKAMREGTAASTQINDLLGDKGITLDRFLSIAKLNTLGIANLFVNPFFNVWFMPIRFLESLTKMGLDYGLKYAGFERADGIYENTFYKQRGYLKGFLGGSSKAVRNIYTGDAQFGYFQKSIKQNIRPSDSFKEILAHHKGEKKLTNAEYANAVMEAFPTMGGTAAIISRGLQLGDLPFRFAAGRGMAENIALQKGLTGVAKEAFILSPDEVSAEKIRDAGQRAVMAQDNILTSALNNLSSYLKHATKESVGGKIGVGITKIVGATTQPFLKIPLNSAMSAFELAVPEFSILKGIYHAIHGNRDLALNAFSRAVVGFALGMAASQIAKAGLVTTTSGDEKKIGTNIYQGDVVGSQTLNYTGFKRWLRGGNPEFSDGDVTVNMNWLGIPGAIMQMYGQKNDEMTAEQWDKQGYLANLFERMDGSFVNGLKNNVFNNTSTLLQAMDGGGAYFVNKWLRGSTGVLANAFEPSWLATAGRISDKYKADFGAMNLGQQLSSTFKERFGFGDDLPKQITVWGEKRTDAPKGTNPILYYYADITKHRNVDTKDFGYNVLALYNRTKEDAVIPSRPSKTFQHNNTSIKLDPHQYEEFQTMVGQNRKQLTQALMNTDTWNALNDEQKVDFLGKIYKSGYSLGKSEFIMKHPELDLPQTEEKK